LLKYAMPVLAEANLSGEFSLDVDGWRVPLFAPEKASGSGRLVIDRLDVEPGLLMRQLSQSFGHPEAIRLAQAMAVPVSMADGRIHHRDLKFTLGNVTVTSRGSVGVDQTLALVAEVELPRSAATNLPLFDAVQRLSIPIGGTLDHPAVDREGLRASGKDLFRDAIDGLMRRGLKRSKQSS
jgi:translocation and assembly module TamB